MYKKILVSLVFANLFILSGCMSPSEKEFIAGCVHSLGDEKRCSCAYDKLEDFYGESKLEKINKGLIDIPNDFFENLHKVALQCQ